MQNKQDNLSSAFRRIFAGTASLKEKERIAGWLSKLDVSERELSFEEVEKQRLELQKNFHERFIEPVPAKRRFPLSVWAPVAAAILIIVAVALFIIPVQQQGKAVSYTETFTHAGERKIVTLSDGSKITMNNSSRIRFPQVFADGTREVFLEGGAFFEINHDKEKPFIVKAGKLRVQVLGTSFDIRNYAADDKADVTVMTGKVGVLADGQEVAHMLSPGRQLSYDRITGRITQIEVNPGDYTGWQKGELIFRNETLAAICKRLERWYDVKITFKTKVLKEKKMSLEQKNESLQNVLKMLSMAGDFKYEIKGKNIQIR